MELEHQITTWGQRVFGPEIILALGEQKNQAQLDMGIFYAAFSRASGVKASMLTGTILPLGFLGGQPLEWQPETWESSTLARAILLGSFMQSQWLEVLEQTLVSADLGETVDIYRLLPLCYGVEGPALTTRLLEGLRSNATPLLKACMWHSPLPKVLLDEISWNRMMLKAFHLDILVEPIQGRADRRNVGLAKMLLSFASEKALAGRLIPVSLWEEMAYQKDVNFRVEVERLMGEHPNQAFRLELGQRMRQPF
jgi:hypothetical protein